MNSLCLPLVRLTPASIARCAANALTEELATYPKPGLVSFVDRGGHPDMDAECFLASIEAIKPYFGEMAKAGATGCRLLDLQRIGVAAEESMLDATGGKNTHRGAIYCLGLLAAAAGKQMAGGDLLGLPLGRIVAESWGEEILLPDALLQTSRGLAMCHRYKINGVRGEAKKGFPSIFSAGLPAFQTALSSTDLGISCINCPSNKSGHRKILGDCCSELSSLGCRLLGELFRPAPVVRLREYNC